MTYDEFWYGDIEMLNAYQLAYSEKVNFESWLNGYYSYNAQIIALANALSGKDSKSIEYPPYISIKENEERFLNLENKIKDKPNNQNDNKYLSQFL